MLIKKFVLHTFNKRNYAFNRYLSNSEVLNNKNNNDTFALCCKIKKKIITSFYL